MNGAIALLPPQTIKKPISKNITITGANQNFLRSFKKNQISLRNSIAILPFY